MKQHYLLWQTARLSARLSVHLGLVLIVSCTLVSGRLGALAQNQLGSWQFWSGLFDSDPPVPPTEGGRRGDVCLIAPMTSPGHMAQVWDSQPTVVWQGAVGRLELQQDDQDAVILEQERGTANFATYEGEPLAPNTIYRWRIYLPYTEQPAFEVPLTVLPTEEKESIAQDLQQLDAELTAAMASAEEKALRRADYFAARGLWSDFWGEVLSVESPSTELEDTIEEALMQLCKTE
ncbi:MAG: hypothetical protein WBA57_03970 [Elainellaceae cyanobacterium]